MVYVAGEEMTRYTMELILDRWVRPHVDTSAWEFFDLRAKNRDDTSDQVLRDVIDAGARLKAIFKEPTITPTADQVKRLGLKKAWGSPNGAMRRGWNGITISRDTIHIDGVELGYKKPVFFERHAVGGEYSAGYKIVGRGKLTTTFVPEGETEPVVVDERDVVDNLNAVVTYHNPLDNVTQLARIFFGRCLDAGITPYVVTKKTVFKWQEPFWATMKSVFDAEFKQKFVDAKIIAPDAELVHLLSDAATMKLVVWTDGGFGMAAHNYDGDVLTDELAQVHMSPGFITSNLVGVDENGTLIKEFEASHGTVTDMDEARLRGEETSLNPLGMVEGLIGAMNHAADVHGGANRVLPYTAGLRATIHRLFREGRGTRDLCGPGGLTTEQFIDAVAEALPEEINK
jgi:isocitrate dehydrogenase